MYTGRRLRGQPLSHSLIACSSHLDHSVGSSHFTEVTNPAKGRGNGTAGSWRCLRRAGVGALGSGLASLLGTDSLSPWGCSWASLVTTEIRSDPLPPDFLGEGGRDRAHLEKPGSQSLGQRNPRSWGSVAGEGAGGPPTALGREERVVSAVSRLREIEEKHYYLHRVLDCTNNPAAELSQYVGVVSVDITPPFHTGES